MAERQHHDGDAGDNRNDKNTKPRLAVEIIIVRFVFVERFFGIRNLRTRKPDSMERSDCRHAGVNCFTGRRIRCAGKGAFAPLPDIE
jgi:hypothetical protein